MAKMIHAMIRVLDLDRSLNFYRDVFGLHVSQKLDFPDFIASHGVHNDAKLAEHVHPD